MHPQQLRKCTWVFRQCTIARDERSGSPRRRANIECLSFWIFFEGRDSIALKVDMFRYLYPFSGGPLCFRRALTSRSQAYPLSQKLKEPRKLRKGTARLWVVERSNCQAVGNCPKSFPLPVLEKSWQFPSSNLKTPLSLGWIGAEFLWRLFIFSRQMFPQWVRMTESRKMTVSVACFMRAVHQPISA